MVRSICCYLSNWPRLSDQPHMTRVFVQVSDVLDDLSIPITIVRSRRNKKQDWNAGMVTFQSWRGCSCRNLNHQMNTSKLLTWFFQYTNNKQQTINKPLFTGRKQNATVAFFQCPALAIFISPPDHELIHQFS